MESLQCNTLKSFLSAPLFSMPYLVLSLTQIIKEMITPKFLFVWFTSLDVYLHYGYLHDYIGNLNLNQGNLL